VGATARETGEREESRFSIHLTNFGDAVPLQAERRRRGGRPLWLVT
jgi:hypothetical protein